MRKYTDEQYIKLVENINDKILQSMMKKEIKVLEKIENPQEKTFIDLGAGHGRLTPTLGKIARNLISIEINPDMLPELRKRNSKFSNAKIIVGDITKLSKELKNEDIKNPVLILVQNSLGTIEGNWRKVLEEMKKVAKENKGEIIISFFKAESMKDWGIKLYTKTKEMTGKPNLEKINFKKGLMVTNTGYTSKWRFEKEVDEITKFLGGKLTKKIETKNWIILHLSYN